uniref:Helitron helicase-like domain-containing protein n=1 Tax=Panagrolaimus superbus TaxID=310955 RepID=A0A914YHM5_9BILA
MKEKRLIESVEEKNERLKKDAESKQIKRENETEEEKKERLQKDSQHKQIIRDNETEEEKKERLQKDLQHKQTIRDNETEEEKKERLESNKLRKEINRTIEKIEKQQKWEKERDERIKNEKTILPFIRRPGANFKDVKPFRLGKRDVICTKCGAEHYRTEPRGKDGSFTNCCQQGKVKMEAGSKDYPKLMKDLMTKLHPDTNYVKVFDLNKRAINSSLSCAHMYATNVQLAPGVPYLKIQGKVLHKMPKLYYPTGNNATFGGQNYIVDSGTATTSRLAALDKKNIKLNGELMEELDILMRNENVFAKSYVMLKDTVEKNKETAQDNEAPKELRLVFKNKPDSARNYDKVEAENEVAFVYQPGPNGEIPRDEIIIFEKRPDGQFVNEYLREWDPKVEPLTYPLFYPTGKGQFYEGQKRDSNDEKSRKLTDREYYAFKTQQRNEKTHGFNPILYGGKLFLQYLCDAWAKVEANRLRYIDTHQPKLRAANYKEVHEALFKKAMELGKAPGTVKILPSTFYGGPRFMRELCSDAISMVDEFGKPTALITMTVNPEDEDIIMNLYKDQKAWERPDVVNSCFYQKMHELIRYVEKSEIFGPVIASVVVVEFQKRGLPHCHCAFTLKEKWDTVEKVDAYVRGYLPPKNQEEADAAGEVYDKEDYELTKKFMIHTPCGIHNPNAPCMVNGKCKRNFPRDNRETTEMDVNGFTKPKCPKNDRSFTMKVKGKDVTVDNRWVQ